MRRLPALLVAATLIVGFVGPGAVAAGVPDAEITTKNSTNFLTPLALLPIKIPVAQAGPITFQNIEEHISEISLAAYEEVQNTLNRNEQPVTKKRIHIGPNTETNVPDVDGAFNKIIKYWSGFRQPATYDALIFSFEDKAWALIKAATIPSVIKSGGVRGFTGIYDQIMGCIAPRQCSDTNSSIVYKAERSALGFFGMDPVLTAGDPYLRNGGVQGSMYTAAVQQSQFLDLPDSAKEFSFNGPSPCWFVAGQSNFIGNAVESDTFDEYMEWRVRMARDHPVDNFKDYSAASIRRVLLTSKPPACLPPNPIYSFGFGIGALVLEAMTAIGGGQSTMAVLTQMGKGTTFAKSFKKVYGISWKKAAPILARVAAAEFALTPLS